MVRQTVELKKGARVTTTPRTDAGRRTVHLPDRGHRRLVQGLARGAEVGVPDRFLHDLRHAAGTLAAQQGASVRELTACLGHASPAASQRYQHAAERRDAVIAAALDEVLLAATRLVGGPDLPLLRHLCAIDVREVPVPPTPVHLQKPPLTREFPRASDGNRTRVLSLGS